MLLDRLTRVWAFCKASTPATRLLTAFVLLIIATMATLVARDTHDYYVFIHLSSAEHLSIAKANLNTADTLAYRHLNSIPPHRA
jgi:hypothetical protein